MSTSKPSGVSAETLGRLVDACRSGTAAPVYLLVGETPETRSAANALIDALVPVERRSFNLETYDGRAASMARVLDSLRTPAFFPGVKVVWVRDSPMFASGAKKGEIAKSMFGAWEAGRQREAAEKLVTLVALAGWSDEQFAGAEWGAVKKTALRDVFGDEVGEAEFPQLQAIQKSALGLGLAVGDFRDDGSLLLAFLEHQPPPDTVLLFTTGAVDARKRVVKRLLELGEVLEFVVERDRSGGLSREGVATLARDRAAAHGQQFESAALELVLRRAGSDTATLASELEKVSLYAAGRKRITEADVRAVVLDQAESWVFDFTGALAARDVGRALPLLRGLMEQGEPPLRLLALVAREVRILLIARESIDALGKGVWRKGTAYAVFQSRVLPEIDPQSKAAFGKIHPFALYRKFEDAAQIPSTSLRRALADLATLDVRFKSSAGDPGLLLESFVVAFCR